MTCSSIMASSQGGNVSDNWYYTEQREQRGPISREQLIAVLERAPNRADMWVWRDGFPEWKRAGDVPELNAAPPPAAPRPAMFGTTPATVGAAKDAAPRSIMQLWFGFSGRINRAKYWLISLINAALMIIGVGLVLAGGSVAALVVFGLIFLAAFVSGLSVAVRRLHDRNKTGWWVVLFYVVPSILTSAETHVGGELILGLIGAVISIWALIELGFLRGTNGPNTYGPDPLQQR